MDRGFFTTLAGSLSLLLVLTAFAHAQSDGLVWSTFLGGSGNDIGHDVAVDGSGYVYVVGWTKSADFPVTPGAFETSLNGPEDVFIAKLDTTGANPGFITLLGGGDDDVGYGIAVDHAGHAYLTGYTSSDDFPVTAEAYDTHLDSTDLFIVKLGPTGDSLCYATFLGGSDEDEGEDIAIDGLGCALVTGSAYSQDFPTTPGALQTEFYHSFVARLSPAGDSLYFSTFLGDGSSNAIAADQDGHAFVVGDAWSGDFPTTPGAFDSTYDGHDELYVLKLSVAGDVLEYSTFLGSNDDGEEHGMGIALDESGKAYVTGYTCSDSFPVTPGAFDVTYNDTSEYEHGDIFVAKLNETGSAIEYCTYLGGSRPEGEYGCNIAVDPFGCALLTGWTLSKDFPTTGDAFDNTFNDTIDYAGDTFVAKLDPLGSSLEYASYLGGSESDEGISIAVSDDGCAYLTGRTGSDDFPATVGEVTSHGGIEAFLARIRMPGTSVESTTLSTGLPRGHVLQQNCPNPFNSSTQIRYRLTENGPVSLRVFNTLGQEVQTLVNDYQLAGAYIVSWDGRNSFGLNAASGIYFCRLQAGAADCRMIKMVLLR